MSNDPDKYGYDVDEKGYWIRKDGFEKDNAIALSEVLTKELQGEDDEMDRFGKVGSFTFFNRLQNIGYTVDDFRNGRCTYKGVTERESLLMHEYKRRLDAI